jgi:hypothetical protein
MNPPQGTEEGAGPRVLRMLGAVSAAVEHDPSSPQTRERSTTLRFLGLPVRLSPPPEGGRELDCPLHWEQTELEMARKERLKSKGPRLPAQVPGAGHSAASGARLSTNFSAQAASLFAAASSTTHQQPAAPGHNPANPSQARSWRSGTLPIDV